MKAKTISKVIRKKMNDWIESLPESMRKEVKKNIIVTGGSIASLLLKEKVNDYDIYFKSSDICAMVLQHYWKVSFVHKLDIVDDRIIYPDHDCIINIGDKSVQAFIKSSGIKKWEYSQEELKNPDKYIPLFLTSNALSLTNDIQLITRFTGSVEEVHSNFDFMHATNYWTFHEGLVVNTEAMLSLMTKELIYQGSKYPLSSIIRTRKFVERQWTVNAGQYLKMILQCNELDLSNIEVLKEQLIGVDLAYFSILVEQLTKDKEKGIEQTQSYILTLIDKIFNSENISEGDE